MISGQDCLVESIAHSMTTLTLESGKKVKLSIEEKARALRVFDIGEEGHLAVESGSKPDTLYVCHHNGYRITYCPCEALHTCHCAHIIAGDWALEAKRREAYHALFSPCTVAGMY